MKKWKGKIKMGQVADNIKQIRRWMIWGLAASGTTCLILLTINFVLWREFTNFKQEVQSKYNSMNVTLRGTIPVPTPAIIRITPLPTPRPTPKPTPTPTPRPPDPLRIGLIGEWLFEGNTLNTAQPGKQAILQGAVLIKGIRGKAFKFGPYKYIRTDPLPIGGNCTISLWVKPTNPYGENNRIFESNELSLTYTGGTITFAYSTGKQSARATTPNVLKEGNWTFLTFTLDTQGVVSTYVNGSLARTDRTGIPLTSFQRSLNLGKSSIKGRDFWGEMDNVRVYARTLSPNDVLNLYQR
jgi:hypothetical protein